jgi:hypothetical protein
MSSIAQTTGFLVSDVRGHAIGHVECPMYGTDEAVPDALAVRSGRLVRRHFIVRATTIEAIDDHRQVIALRVGRDQLQRFL